MAPHILSKSQADYILTGLTADPPQRRDARSLLAYRPIQVETGIAAQASGSAQVSLGGTEVFCGVKAQVETFQDDSDQEDEPDYDDDQSLNDKRHIGRVKCAVEYSQSLLHTFESRYLETLITSLNSSLNSLFSSRCSPIPLAQLLIIANAKRWTVYIDLMVNSVSGGNLFDAAFASVFAAVYDVKIPLTRGVAFEAPVTSIDKQGASIDAVGNSQGDLDSMGIKGLVKSKTKTRQMQHLANPDSKVVDFELENHYDEGASLSGRENVPVCVTVNVLPQSYLLDASLEEETCISSRIRVIASRLGKVHAVKVEGSEEVGFKRIAEAVKIGTVQAAALSKALANQLELEAKELQNQLEASMELDV